eukprot:1157710-Pelagomonas_calceolata.AAC.7
MLKKECGRYARFATASLTAMRYQCRIGVLAAGDYGVAQLHGPGCSVTRAASFNPAGQAQRCFFTLHCRACCRTGTKEQRLSASQKLHHLGVID